MEQLQTIFKFISFLCIKEVYSNILQGTVKDSENKCHNHNGEQSSAFGIIGKYFIFHTFKWYPSLFDGYPPFYLPGYLHCYPSGYPTRPCKANPCKYRATCNLLLFQICSKLNHNIVIVQETYLSLKKEPLVNIIFCLIKQLVVWNLLIEDLVRKLSVFHITSTCTLRLIT